MFTFDSHTCVDSLSLKMKKVIVNCSAFSDEEKSLHIDEGIDNFKLLKDVVMFKDEVLIV